MLHSVDFDDVSKILHQQSQGKGVFKLCIALQLQMYAKYALDWYLCKNSFWATVCKTVRPMISDCYPVYLSCL